jgi:hypothetical protein
MKINKLYILAIVALSIVIGSYSCTEEFDMDLDDGQIRLVVDAEIRDSVGISYVKLLESKPNIYDVGTTPITGADVVVFEDGTEIILVESPGEVGLYNFPEGFKGKYGSSYTLQIDGVDIDKDGESLQYEATAKMPQPIILDSIGYVYQRFFREAAGFFVTCYAQEPQGENFYVFRAYKNGVEVTDTLGEREIQTDVLYEGKYIPGLSTVLMFDGKADERLGDGDIVTLQIDNIPEDYFNYLMDVRRTQSGAPMMFAGPPANVRNNLNNDALGVFRVYSSSFASVVVKNPDSLRNVGQ